MWSRPLVTAHRRRMIAATFGLAAMSVAVAVPAVGSEASEGGGGALMRWSARIHMHGRRMAVMVAGLGVALSLAGCSFIAADRADDQVEEIPAALLASDVGATDAYAEKGLNGFTHYLAVGVDLDDHDLTDSDLASVLQIVVDENDLPLDQIKLSIHDVDGEPIALESMMEQLVPGVVVVTSYEDVRITIDGAREIIDAVSAQR
ncbi:hypothetical protein ACIPV2_00005 [Microbacterium sp. NPDC089987]|uniref:hypothetical protein n=1 Tax=Microbacterium sp. NPDC089987 TaxID=3364202 RepID=UPI0038005FEF